jgi:chemotaxis protein CheD
MSAVAFLEESLARVYLHPGQVVTTSEPMLVTTVLGSCVATCLWDPQTLIAGVNHFLLPQGPTRVNADPRYGNTAMQRLIDSVLERGASRERLVAKVFGGACVIEQFSGIRRSIGDQNAAIALEVLAQNGIRVQTNETGGKRGRKVLFHTGTGGAFVKEL